MGFHLEPCRLFLLTALLVYSARNGICLASFSTSGYEPIFQTVGRFVAANRENVLQGIDWLMEAIGLAQNEEYVQRIKPELGLLGSENLSQCDNCKVILLLCCYLWCAHCCQNVEF